MNDKDKNILYLGFSGFPYGLAEFQKIVLISKALLLEGACVTVLCSKGMYDEKLHPGIRKIGHFQGIQYVYSSRSAFRTTGFIRRKIDVLCERIREFNTIRRLKSKREYGVAIVSSMSFTSVLFYRLCSRLFRFKLLLNLVEYNSAIAGREEIKFRINDYLFDYFAVKLSDGVLVISEFLIRRVKMLAPKKPYLKIPVLVDPKRFQGIERMQTGRYFLFCGAAGYKEIILFIIESFECISQKDVNLWLVINGNTAEMEGIEKRIAISDKKGQIKIMSNISDRELSELYINATGLLIPVRPTLQDEARFPHKFGEYLLSGNPIVTTNNGEVRFYFKDMDNALVAEKYEVRCYAEKMNFVLSCPAESQLIGLNGKRTALEFADYEKYGKKIIDFIDVC